MHAQMYAYGLNIAVFCCAKVLINFNLILQHYFIVTGTILLTALVSVKQSEEYG